MTVELFIGNLNYDTDNKTLKDYLNRFGKVLSCKITLDKFTYRSKGFARVKAADEEAARNIIKEAAGTVLEGRPLKISYYIES